MCSNTLYTRYKTKIQFSNVILIFAIEAVLLNYRGAEAAIKIKCTNADDFYFTSPGSQCGMYYKCTARGEKETRECSPGLNFDFYAQSCGYSMGKCSEPSCIGRPNGIYQDTTHACMRSFTCYSGQLTSIDNCPPNYLHNGQKCVQQDHVQCGATTTTNYTSGKATQTIVEDQLCQQKRDGSISDPTSKDCTTYIQCKAGKYNGRGHCSNQAVFNGESCVPSPLHECSLSKRHAPDIRSIRDHCYRKSNGYYAYPQHGCTSYIRCLSEQMVEVGLCPPDQYFDMEIGKCVYERTLERRRCFERGHSKDCDGRVDGYYAADAKCETYYYCSSSYKIEYKCSPGKVFNGQVCVLKSQYKCPMMDVYDAYCDSHSDGYYKDNSDGCRAYSYCSNGHKITYMCEQGHIFDMQHKKCIRKDLHCHSNYACHGKSDGYHVDLKSNCRSYIYCINNEKITEITCRDGKIFNGQQCVPPTEYDCPSLFSRRETNCVPRQCLKRCESNGFYADLSSSCRDFHICINGKSSKSSCQPGMRFNGEICVSEDKFTCPTVCSSRRHESNRECPAGIGYIG